MKSFGSDLGRIAFYLLFADEVPFKDDIALTLEDLVIKNAWSMKDGLCDDILYRVL